MYKYLFAGFLFISLSIPGIAQTLLLRSDSTNLPTSELGEVVIAASRDETRLKRMPASVSVISPELLENNEIRTLDQISGMVPNFYMPDYGSKLTSPVYIRGVGSRINSPSVGLYVDNVPYFEKAAFDFEFFDIEQIEILRGPQGTLYGRNTLGGLINVRTLSPWNYQGNRLKLSAANYGDYSINAGKYQKYGEKFAYAIAMNYKHNDGFYNNAYTGNKVDQLNSFGFRTRVIFKPTENLTLENIISSESSWQGGYPYAVLNDSTNKANNINYNQYSSYNRQMLSDGLSIKYAASGWELSSTISYQYIDDEQDIDQDFTPDSLYFIGQFLTQNMFSAEVIARSRNNSRYQWLFGGFGFMQLFDKSVEANLYTRDMWYLKVYDLDVSSLGFFHQSTWKPFDDLVLTAGLRYDYEWSGLGYTYVRELAGAGAATDTTYPGLEDHVLLPKLAVNYQAGNHNLYFSYTEGYKPGGYNSTFEAEDQLTFSHESSSNYELGVKSSFLNHSIYADAAVFITRIDDQQIYRTVPSGQGSYLDNAGKSENKGAELTLRNRPIKGFGLMFSYAYTESKILEYVQNASVNYNNQYSPYIPKSTWSVSLTKSQKTFALSWLDEIKGNILLRQMGNLYWTLENDYKQDPYYLLDAKVSFLWKGLQFDLWGRNLLNAEYHAFLFEALGRTYVQEGKPMQVGVNLSIHF